MKNLKNLFVLGLALLVISISAFAQATTASTTFSTTVQVGDQQVYLTSATGVSSATQGAFNTVLYADREAMGVISVVGTLATVQRGIDGTIVSGHQTSATVWVGPPNYFSQNVHDPSGYCLNAQGSIDALALPRIFEMSGNGYMCPAAGPNANQWTLQYPAPTTTLPTDTSLWGIPIGLKVCHASYSFAVDGGAVGLITPKRNCVIPINAVIYQGFTVVGVTTVGSSGNVSVGLSAGGGGAAAILAATARASLTTGLMFQAPPVPTTASASNTSMIKMSAAGTVTVTVATNALTSGDLEIYVFYLDLSI
jgi:hypothetical protein